MAKRTGWENMKDWADEALLANAYRGLSVNTRVFRTRLRTAQRSFCDPNVPQTPTMHEVDKTAAWVSEQVGIQTGIRSGIASLAGAISIPPEVLLTLVTYIRLAQKLTIVYGYDPHSDKGQMVMWRALAAGLETELPEQGPLGMRLRDLTRLFSMPRADQVGTQVTRALVKKSVWAVLRRTTRYVPVLSLGSSTIGGRRRMRSAGHRMNQVLRRLCDSETDPPLLIQEAVEVVSH